VARGEAHVQLTNGLVRALASASHPLLALRIEDADLARFDPAAWRLTAAGGTTRRAANGLRAEIAGPDGSALAVAVSAVERDGGVEISITAVNGAEDAAPLVKAESWTREALAAGYARLLGEHISAYRTAFGSATVELPDPVVQDHYDFVRYLTLCASRRGAPPAALQGPWTVDLGVPPWHGDYHNDLNLQMTHAATLTAGLMDSALALFDFHARLLPRFREFARDFYGVPGAVVPGVMALDGAPLGGWAQYALSPTNSAWTGELTTRFWNVTRDAPFLNARALPFCRDVATALEALAPAGPDGKRRLALSSSPEIHDNSLRAWLAPNSNYDLALLRAAFANAALLERAAGNGPEAARWERTLGELPPFELDDRGALALARGEPLAESHRHLSHALAIHPLAQLTIEGDARERGIVDATVDGILAQGTRGWTGYTFAWFAALCARTGRPELARSFLADYERAFTLRNGLHVNGDQSGEGLSGFVYRPFTLEGNMIAMEAVHEMLLQSWGGTIRVFPAVSASWPDVAFGELRADGAFVVSARRIDGLTRSVTVRALAGGPLRLRDPFPGREPHWTNPSVRRDGRDWVLDMVFDEVLIGTCDAGR
jgi:alpha-L-fucosidase 2